MPLRSGVPSAVNGAKDSRWCVMPKAAMRSFSAGVSLPTASPTASWVEVHHWRGSCSPNPCSGESRAISRLPREMTFPCVSTTIALVEVVDESMAITRGSSADICDMFSPLFRH